MKVFVGADHRGFDFKNKIIRLLEKDKHQVRDLGTYDDKTSCDYPQIAQKLAREVVKSRQGRGILICMSGIGQSIAANKVKGAYAALCHNEESAKLSRLHNNSNILVLSAKFIEPRQLVPMIKTWLTTEFEGGRHLRRVNQIRQIERGKKIG